MAGGNGSPSLASRACHLWSRTISATCPFAQSRSTCQTQRAPYPSQNPEKGATWITSSPPAYQEAKDLPGFGTVSTDSQTVVVTAIHRHQALFAEVTRIFGNLYPANP